MNVWLQSRKCTKPLLAGGEAWAKQRLPRITVIPVAPAAATDANGNRWCAAPLMLCLWWNDFLIMNSLITWCVTKTNPCNELAFSPPTWSGVQTWAPLYEIMYELQPHIWEADISVHPQHSLQGKLLQTAADLRQVTPKEHHFDKSRLPCLKAAARRT